MGRQLSDFCHGARENASCTGLVGCRIKIPPLSLAISIIFKNIL
jgi:hypothetical protein